MPISKENKKLYPENWQEIRAEVQARSGGFCEGSPKYKYCRAQHGQPHPITKSIVVLTVAHLDHNPANCDMDNLRHWCQRCHNTYDAKHRAETRRKKKEANNKNQKTLF